MSTILYLSDISLENPNRGTPLRIHNILVRLRHKHSIIVCARAVSADLSDVFVPFPKLSAFKKLRFLKSLVREKKVTHVFTTTETGIVAPVVLKLVCGVKIAMDLHGLYADELLAAGQIGRWRYLRMKTQAWILLPFYDLVFPCLRKLARYYRPFSSHWITVYGGINIDEIVQRVPSASRTPFIIGYMGNARPYQGVQYIFEAAAEIKRRGIPIALNLIISRGGEIEKMLKEHGLTGDAIIHKEVPHAEAERLISGSHVLAIARPSMALTEHAFPSKLPEYLATGIPTIVTAVGPVEELRKELATCAIIIPAKDIARHLADAFVSVHTMPDDEYHALGTRAREYALRTFNWDRVAGIITNAFV